MNILYYFKDLPTPMYRWQHHHIIDELSHHNHSITIFNPCTYQNKEEANEKLIKHIAESDYDLFMTPHGDEEIYLDTILEVKKKGIPTLLICFDNLIVPFMHEKIAGCFDLVWLTAKETGYLFKKHNNTIILPYAANPHFLKPMYGKEIKSIGFIGNPYGSRQYIISNLLKNKIDVTLYHNNNSIKQTTGRKIEKSLITLFNFSRFQVGRKVIYSSLIQRIKKSTELDFSHPNLTLQPAVKLEEMNSFLTNHSICLSFTSALKTEILKNPVPIINLRSFEIPMAAGFQFCRYNEELASYFEEDKEIIFYRNNEDLVSKAKFYLKPENLNLRNQIKIAARERAINEHTWFHRFSQIFEILGITNK